MISALAGSLIGSGISAIGSLFGNLSSSSRTSQALSAQHHENEIARQWNEKMYNQQVADARQNVSDERAYNTPSAQIERLRDAGLNPDLMYGNGTSGLSDNTVASSGSVGNVPPADVGSIISSSPLATDNILKGVEIMKGLAEAANIKADTAKKQGELTSLDIDNFIKAATQGSSIELQNMQVDIGRQALALSKSEQSKVLQEIKNLESQNSLCNSQIAEIQAKISNLDSQTVANRVNTYLAGKDFDLRCRQLAQQIKVSDNEAKCLLIQTMASKFNLDQDTLLKRANVSKVNAEALNQSLLKDTIMMQGRILNIQLDNDAKFSSFERAASIAEGIIGAVSDVASGAFFGTSALKNLKELKNLKK
ncbi:minor capsid protein [Lepus americanus faeces associated microvirus SHP1 6472]|uniref:minor capsid protein n=1 Tax=Lepus americanus faeces associated microvirus SHP1 6472 TaxID=2219217 RepID=UPI000DF0B32E|nr:minor capsid protein [Lepus americanus faeces associated microvirus SHP1 6472]AXB22591.1 minor capsid protein [Lepus americanus faeces associated microvirus SHP1 6472]